MQENNNYIQPQYEEEQEIAIMELISKLWKKKAMIIKWCIAGAVIGLVAGFSIPKTYSAGVTLAPFFCFFILQGARTLRGHFA